MRLGELVAGMVAWALLAAAGAAVAGSPQGAASGMEAPCPTTEVIFRLVPGRFDYCVARKRWAQGDYAGAREMLLIAARWSDKNAQLALGAAYLQGVGFRQDRPLGLAWLMLACERHVAPYQVLCDESLHAASSGVAVGTDPAGAAPAALRGRCGGRSRLQALPDRGSVHGGQSCLRRCMHRGPGLDRARQSSGRSARGSGRLRHRQPDADRGGGGPVAAGLFRGLEGRGPGWVAGAGCALSSLIPDRGDGVRCGTDSTKVEPRAG